MTTAMKHLDLVLNSYHDVLDFLKEKYPVYHFSNIFFRDVHYGIRAYLKERKINVSYRQGEEIASAFLEKLERERIATKLDLQTWAVRYEKFKTPVTKAPAAVPGAKPMAAPTPIAQ
jgi:hypothetical protein